MMSLSESDTDATTTGSGRTPGRCSPWHEWNHRRWRMSYDHHDDSLCNQLQVFEEPQAEVPLSTNRSPEVFVYECKIVCTFVVAETRVPQCLPAAVLETSS